MGKRLAEEGHFCGGELGQKSLYLLNDYQNSDSDDRNVLLRRDLCSQPGTYQQYRIRARGDTGVSVFDQDVILSTRGGTSSPQPRRNKERNKPEGGGGVSNQLRI